MGSGDLGAEAGRKRLAELVRSTGAFKHSEEGFKLASGKISKHYFDLRLLSGDPRGLHMAARVMYDLIKTIPGVKSVGGLESGSIPLAAAISHLSYIEHVRDPTNPPLTSFFVRKATKKHGTKKIIEGNVASPAVVVDDVITTGMSAIRAIDVIRKEGYKCARLICIIFRGSSNDSKNIRKKAQLQSIFKESDFVKTSKSHAPTPLKLLVDAMYSKKLAQELRKLGYDAKDVQDLQKEGKRAHYDHSIILRATEEKMILITRDNDMYGGCVAEGVPCIKLGKNPTVKDIVAALNDPDGFKNI